MENLRQHYGLKSPLMKFMTAVYLEADHGIQEELAHSTLFKIFTTDVVYVVEDNVVDTDVSNYLFDCLIPGIKGYFKDFAGLAKGTDEQSEMARSILSSLADLFDCCRHNWQKGRVADIARTMLRQERLFTNIIQDGQWQARTHKIQRLFNFHTDEEDVGEESGDLVDDGGGGVQKKEKSQFEKAMIAMKKDKDILDQAELEFEEMCQAYKDVEEITGKLRNVKISFELIIHSLVNLVDINEFNLPMELTQGGLKLLRKCVEMENPDSTLPASEWESEDWEDYKDVIVEWQERMNELGCVQLIMNLVGLSTDTPIVMDAIDLGVTLLLGGNKTVQDGFQVASRKKNASAFFRKLDDLLNQSYDEMKAAGSDPRAAGAPEAEKDEGEEEDEEEEDDFDENKNATIVFRFMQLLCEGHNDKCQRMIQHQKEQHVSFDLVQKTLSITNLLCCEMSSDLDEDRMEAACQALDTLTEVIQGPCASAQRALMDAKVLDTCSQIMADPFTDAFEDEPDHPLIMDIKEKTITLLLSLLEGVSKKSVFIQFGEVLEFDVLQRRMAQVYMKCVEECDLDPLEVAEATSIPEDIYFGDLNEAFGIYMLMATLSVHSELARSAINPVNLDKNDRAGRVALEFFQKNAGTIEINWSGKVERVYFPIPPICEFLTEASRQKVLWGVDREMAGEKMMGFYMFTDELQAEMVHLQKMSQFQMISLLSKNFESFKTWMLALGFVINLILVVDMQTTTITDAADDIADLYANIEFKTPILQWVCLGLGLIQTLLTVFIAVGVLAMNGPLAIDNAWSTMIRLQGKPKEDDPEPEEGSYEMLMKFGPEEAGVFDGEAGCTTMVSYYLMSFYFLISDGAVLIHMSYFLFSLAGNIITPFLQAWHLLDLVYRSETLKNVLKAVTDSAGQLGMTALLCMIVLYYYAILGFLVARNNFFLPDDFPDVRPCDKMFDCFVVTTREGLLNGGGMADYLPPRSVEQYGAFFLRFFFDLSFFIIVLIILMNIIFGIILDTFAALREETQNKTNDMKNTCFICSIDRSEFDRNGTPFEIHIKSEHNMWMYLYYLVYLKTKDETEFTGLESYVAELLEEEDVSFYPMYKALCLGTDEEDEDPFQVEMKENFEKIFEMQSFMKKTVMDMKTEQQDNQLKAVDVNKGFTTSLEQILAAQEQMMSELNTARQIT